jgi:hypothetical protein
MSCEEVRIQRYHWLFLGVRLANIALAFYMSDLAKYYTKKGQRGFTTGAKSMQLPKIHLPQGRDLLSC